jgi:hypothetical protein
MTPSQAIACNNLGAPVKEKQLFHMYSEISFNLTLLSLQFLF